MKIAVWETGHEIADTVADALKEGVSNVHLLDIRCAHDGMASEFDIHAAYGILRGTQKIFHSSHNWFNLDRGYFRPGHYSGYYRISYRGTQQCSNWPEPDYDRLRALNLHLRPWRGFDHNKPVLIIPPTEHVRNFFDIGEWKSNTDGVVRCKKDSNYKIPIDYSMFNYVHTFNSSVGWQALLAGIPCVSDTTHSIVGSWFKNQSIDAHGDFSLAKLSEAQYLEREKLFATMSALQFTLDEIKQEKAWPLISRYIGNDSAT